MAYADITALLENLEFLLQSDPHPILHYKEQVESLHDKVNLLRGFLEESEKRYDRGSMKHLELEIRDVFYKARKVIDSKLLNVYAAKSAKSWKKARRILRRSLRKLTEKVDFILKKLNKISQKRKNAASADLQAGEPVLGGLSRRVYMENHVVGLNNDLQIVKDRLTQSPLRLETIPIVGMGGVGKTTLARRLYEDPSIVLHFHVRLWVTVSQDFQIRILLQDLCQLGNDNEMNNADLAEHLYKSLKGRRYLIVLDDIWCTEAWDAVKSIFPDDNNGSRIILTSRLKEVAVHANRKKPLHIKLLDPEVGKEIAAKCQGLPLAIVVVAGYLLKIDRTRDCWDNFADSVASYVTGDPQQCLDIIALSYNQLPPPLKACFLYFGAFPEDREIPVSRLIYLWVAEGFLKQVTGKSLEEIAEECLMDLIDRNLILVRRVSYGRIKTCIIHDILRDLCLREAEKENFMHVVNHNSHVFHEGKTIAQRLSFHMDCSFPILSTTHIDSLPSTISHLWNLQTLVLNIYSGCTTLPWKLWTIQQLRHLHFNFCSFLPNPAGAEINGQGDLVLRNLQTLSKLSFSSCTMQVIASLPNLKKLGLYETAEAHSNCWSYISNVAQLHQLEILKLNFINLFAEERRWVPCVDEFPPNLKKLTLSSSYLPWKDMNVLSMLPNLEVLKLKNNAFVGSDWEQYEEGFSRLKYLLIDKTDLVHWRATSTQFPSLKHLRLFRCRCLREVPLDFAEIPYLQIIDVYGSYDAVRSVMQIKQEQESVGNDDLLVRFDSAV
ncbi:unnamed protein product [Coffea canephora]|uniref:Uncharacterized protein n=1 Tax=Coffea canephora TaxID=49390 RepID=A0A068UQJ3_COFCA|nr:unnamed protein product [Coffea canephora]